MSTKIVNDSNTSRLSFAPAQGQVIESKADKNKLSPFSRLSKKIEQRFSSDEKGEEKPNTIRKGFQRLSLFMNNDKPPTDNKENIVHNFVVSEKSERFEIPIEALSFDIGKVNGILQNAVMTNSDLVGELVELHSKVADENKKLLYSHLAQNANSNHVKLFSQFVLKLSSMDAEDFTSSFIKEMKKEALLTFIEDCTQEELPRQDVTALFRSRTFSNLLSKAYCQSHLHPLLDKLTNIVESFFTQERALNFCVERSYLEMRYKEQTFAGLDQDALSVVLTSMNSEKLVHEIGALPDYKSLPGDYLKEAFNFSVEVHSAPAEFVTHLYTAENGRYKNLHFRYNVEGVLKKIPLKAFRVKFQDSYYNAHIKNNEPKFLKLILKLLEEIHLSNMPQQLKDVLSIRRRATAKYFKDKQIGNENLERSLVGNFLFLNIINPYLTALYSDQKDEKGETQCSDANAVMKTVAAVFQKLIKENVKTSAQIRYEKEDNNNVKQASWTGTYQRIVDGYIYEHQNFFDSLCK